MFGLFKRKEKEARQETKQEDADYVNGINLLIMAIKGLVPEVESITEISTDEALKMGASPVTCGLDLTCFCVNYSKGSLPLCISYEAVKSTSKLTLAVGLSSRKLREKIDER